MSKICILSAVNIRHMSLISLYTDILEAKGIPYDVIYMDKYGEEELIGADKKYVFTNIINPALPKWLRGLKYFRFVKYAKSIMERNRYEFVVVWNDVAILLFGLYLARKWKGRYCLNVRDYCHQRFRPIFAVFKRAIKGAAFVTISSDGYRAFLPQWDYMLINSINEKVIAGCRKRLRGRCEGEPIRIGFVGAVRFYDVNKRLLDAFRDDDRFELLYYGSRAEVLEEYAACNGIQNAVFSGAFPIGDTSNYINCCDIINNVYGSGSPSVDYALSIKMYYALYCHLPVLVCPNTYAEEICDQVGIGYTVNVGDMSGLPDLLYDWYSSLDYDELSERCEHWFAKCASGNIRFKRKFADIAETLR